MIMSKKLNFIFFHIVKTAGTSITQALKKYDDRSPFNKFLDNKLFFKFSFLSSLNPFPYHIGAFELKTKIGEELFNQFFKFTIVRNPWDWQVSLYHYIIQHKYHMEHRAIREMSFEEYLKWRIKKENIFFQQSFITDKKNNLLVDYVGKFETINKDIDKVSDKIGVKIELPYKNKSNHKNYNNYYSEESRKLIEQHFKKDIELFNYSFE